jgi:hypothetical protein
MRPISLYGIAAFAVALCVYGCHNIITSCSPPLCAGGLANPMDLVHPTHTDLPANWLSFALRDENGDIDPEGLDIALEQRAHYLVDHMPTDGFGDNGTAILNWSAVGPQNVGGRTRSIVIDPDDDKIMWAGAVDGGVWKSVDRGEHWSASNEFLQNFAINCLAIDPTPINGYKPLWAGTGEGFSGVGAVETTGSDMRFSEPFGKVSFDKLLCIPESTV